MRGLYRAANSEATHSTGRGVQSSITPPAAARTTADSSMVRGRRATMRRNTGSSLGLRATSTHNLSAPRGPASTETRRVVLPDRHLSRFADFPAIAGICCSWPY